MSEQTNIQAILQEEVARLVAWAEGQGEAIAKTASDVALYASERAELLKAAVGEPGYAEAVQAEAHNVALYAGIAAVDAGDRVDAAARLAFVEVMRSTLSITAKVLAGLVV